MKTLRTFLSSLLIVGLSSFSIPSIADDTEIYTQSIPKTDISVRPNLLFIMDNSGSMGESMPATGLDPSSACLNTSDKANVTGNTPTRMTVLKDALCKVLDDAQSLNIGLERFSFDQSWGGNTPILYPVKDISSTVPASTVAYNIPIASGSDDAEEGLADEPVAIAEKTIEMTNRNGTDVLFKNTTKSIQATIAASTDNARESLGNKTTAGTISSSELTLGANNTDGEQTVGLRFAGVQIPTGATILAAWVELMAFNTNCNCNQPINIKISGFDSANTDTFTTSANNISSRALTTAATVGWNNVEAWTDKKIYQTPDLSEIIQALIAKSGWASGNAIGFNFIREPVYSATAPDNANLANRRFYSFGETGGSAPVLKIIYSTDTSSTAPITGSAAAAARELSAITQQISDPTNDAYEYLGNTLGYSTMLTDYPDGVARKNAAITTTQVYDVELALGEGKCIRSGNYSCSGQRLVGFRFPNLNIPQNTTVLSASIELTSYKQGTSNDGVLASTSYPLNLNIFVQDAANPGPFVGGNFNYEWGKAGTVNSNLSSRLPPIATAPKVTWTGVALNNLNATLTTPDLAPIINPILSKPDWNPSSNALVFLLKPTVDAGAAVFQNVTSSSNTNIASRVGSRPIYDYSDGDTDGRTRAARLKILLSGKETKPASQQIGLRFQNVKVPRGATVKAAYLSFTSGVKNSSTASLKVVGENVGDSKTFENKVLNISGRSKTSASVTWSSSSSGNGKMVAWDDGGTYSTPDLKAIVQEVVNRSDWCGGNNLGFIITDATSGKTSLRNVVSFDQDPTAAPVLHVEFYPQGLPTNTCIQQTFSTNITNANDDGVQTLIRDGSPTENTATPNMFLASADCSQTAYCEDKTLNITSTKNTSGSLTKRMVGVRFRNIPLKKGATILSAKLVFTGSNTLAEGEDSTTTNAALAANAALTIQGEAGLAAPFATTHSNFSSRTKTASVSWNIPNTGTGLWATNSPYDSPDLKAIVQSIVDSASWDLNGSMAFFVTSNDESSLRKAASFEQSPTLNTRLEIKTDGLLGNDTSFNRTLKDLIKEEVQLMKPLLYTPTADALYEAALYYRGSKVSGGASNRRGDKDYRISNPLSHDKPIIFADADYDITVTPKEPKCQPDVASYPLASVCASEKIDTSTGVATYISPMTDSVCQTNHIILLSDGLPTKNNVAGIVIANGGNKPAKSYSAACGSNTSNQTAACKSYVDDLYASDSGGMATITCSTAAPSSTMGKCGPEIAKFLATSDNKTNVSGSIVKTHTIGMQIDGEPGGEAYLKAIAAAGKGSYYRANTAEELLLAFRTILATAMTDSATFASPAVSINMFNRLYHNNEIYFTFFRPSNKIAWEGNVKRYNMCTDATVNPKCQPCTDEEIKLDKCKMLILGGDGESILDGNDAISEKAFDVWNTSTEPDGAKVTMAGAGGVLPDPNNRKIYSNVVGDTAIALTDALNAVATENASLTSLMLNVATDANPTTARTNLINWIRGYEDVVTNKVREWRFGDPLHSTPGVFTYGQDSVTKLPKTKVIVNTNEGAIRMLDGKTGVEDWMFIPRDMLAIQKDLKNNAASSQRLYGIDGKPVVWVRDNDNNGIIESANNDSAWVFTGMRRGGKNIYALQVTPDTANPPAHKPRLMWTIFGGQNSAQGDFSKLGQTWSTPIVTKVLYNGTSKTVLLFAGGFDATTQDNSLNYQQQAIMGNTIYMVDPLDGGKLLWMAGNANNANANLKLTSMNYSFPSDLVVIDGDRDGLSDRIYVGDTGGQLWRIDIRDVGRGYAVGGRLAILGDPSTNAGKRRFFYPPDVAPLRDKAFSPYAPDFDLVLIGSGYREHPLDKIIEDRLYAFRDRQINWLVGDANGGKSGNAVQDTPAFLDQTVEGGSSPAVTKFFTITEDKLYDATTEVLNTSTNRTSLDGAKAAIQKRLGWKVDLKDATGGFVGEKALSAPLVFGGIAYYTTFVPPQPLASRTQVDVCNMSFDQGKAKSYAINILTGEAGIPNEPRSKDIGGGISGGPIVIFTKDGAGVYASANGDPTDLTKAKTSFELLGPRQIPPRETVFWIEE